jgi:tellurite resistance protein TehA-like permease
MAAFLLYNFHASWLWWVGFIVIILFEVLYELDEMQNRKIKNKAIMDSIIGKDKKK